MSNPTVLLWIYILEEYATCLFSLGSEKTPSIHPHYTLSTPEPIKIYIYPNELLCKIICVSVKINTRKVCNFCHMSYNLPLL